VGRERGRERERERERERKGRRDVIDNNIQILKYEAITILNCEEKGYEEKGGGAGWKQKRSYRKLMSHQDRIRRSPDPSNIGDIQGVCQLAPTLRPDDKRKNAL